MNKLLLPFLLLVLSSLACGLGPDFVTPCENCVNMVQPNGWQPSRDSQYAGGVNLPNSEANLNNAMAQKAQAEAAVAQSEVYANMEHTDYKSGLLFGSMGAVLLIIVVLLFGGLGLIYAFAYNMAKRMSGSKTGEMEDAPAREIVTYYRKNGRFERR